MRYTVSYFPRDGLAYLNDLEALARLTLAIGDRNVGQQRRVADNRRKRVAVLMCRPFAETLATKWG